MAELSDKQKAVLAKNKFKKGDDPRRMKNPPGRPRKKERASLVKGLVDYIEKHPDYREKLIDLWANAAIGNVDIETAEKLSKVRGMEVLKELFNRVDGPLIKKQTVNVRSDKTVIIHDGPAVKIDVGEKLDDEDGATHIGPG